MSEPRVDVIAVQGEEIPRVLRQVRRADLAEQFEHLSDLDRRTVELHVRMTPEGPILVESSP